LSSASGGPPLPRKANEEACDAMGVPARAGSPTLTPHLRAKPRQGAAIPSDKPTMTQRRRASASSLATKAAATLLPEALATLPAERLAEALTPEQLEALWRLRGLPSC
jgi:hypothetical protein